MRIHHLGIVEWEGDAIYMLNTHGGARQTSKNTTAQISIVASVVNLIMVTLAHILSICKEVSHSGYIINVTINKNSDIIFMNYPFFFIFVKF